MEMQELDGIDDEKVELSGKVFSIEKQQRFVEFQKDAKKYVIFVVALPLIGVIGLVIYGALSYEYGMNSNNMEILPNSAEGRTNTNIILCSSNPCSENAECEDQEKGFFCKCNTGWLGKCKLYFLFFSKFVANLQCIAMSQLNVSKVFKIVTETHWDFCPKFLSN